MYEVFGKDLGKNHNADPWGSGTRPCHLLYQLNTHSKTAPNVLLGPSRDRVLDSWGIK